MVVTDETSRVIKTRCKCIPIGMNNVAEIHALSIGLDLLISLNLKDVVIEGDSLVIFYAVTN